MQAFPHEYTVDGRAFPRGDITLDSDRLPALCAAPPPEFDGPGDRWSPETLLVAAVSSCYVLTFRAVAAVAGCRGSRSAALCEEPSTASIAPPNSASFISWWS